MKLLKCENICLKGFSIKNNSTYYKTDKPVFALLNLKILEYNCMPWEQTKLFKTLRFFYICWNMHPFLIKYIFILILPHAYLCLDFVIQFSELVHFFRKQFCLILTYRFGLKWRSYYFQYGFISLEQNCFEH